MIRLIINVFFKVVGLIVVIAVLIAAASLLVASYAPHLVATTSQFALFAVAVSGGLLLIFFVYRLEALRRACNAQLEHLENRINDLHNIVLSKRLRIVGNNRSRR